MASYIQPRSPAVVVTRRLNGPPRVSLQQPAADVVPTDPQLGVAHDTGDATISTVTAATTDVHNEVAVMHRHGAIAADSAAQPGGAGVRAGPNSGTAGLPPPQARSDLGTTTSSNRSDAVGQQSNTHTEPSQRQPACPVCAGRRWCAHVVAGARSLILVSYYRNRRAEAAWFRAIVRCIALAPIALVSDCVELLVRVILDFIAVLVFAATLGHLSLWPDCDACLDAEATATTGTSATAPSPSRGSGVGAV